MKADADAVFCLGDPFVEQLHSKRLVQGLRVNSSFFFIKSYKT